MKIMYNNSTSAKTGYIVLCQTESGDLICPSWGSKLQFGLDKLELEVTNFVNELEALDYDEDEAPKTIDDLIIFAINDEFTFKIEKTEKVVTETIVKLELKRRPTMATLLPHLSMIEGKNKNNE